MKALIVDDERAAVIAVKMLVDWKRYQIETVYEASSSEDVLPLIRTEDPDYHIRCPNAWNEWTGTDFRDS